MLNEVKFIGNLTKDIEVRKTTSDKSVANLDIALNYYVQNEKKTEYVQVVVWEKQAEDAAEYLAKGRQVYVEAKVIIRKRVVEGKNIPIPEFHAERVLYLGASNNQSGGNDRGTNQDFQQGNQDFSRGNQGLPQGFQQQDPFSSHGGGSMHNQSQIYDNPFGR